jgi:hypothetical protein
MSDRDKPSAAGPETGLDWTGMWQAMTESSNRMAEAWSGSMAPSIATATSACTPFGVADMRPR